MRSSETPNAATNEAVNEIAKEIGVSAFGMRVLRKLATGAMGRWSGPSGYRLPGMVVPPSLVEELRRRNLVCLRTPDGGNQALVIAEPGIYFVRRRDAKKAGRKSAAPRVDQYAAQHQLLAADRAGAKNTRAGPQPSRNLGESPIGWLATRKDSNGRAFVAPRQLEAAEQLRSDFEAASFRQRLTANYEGIPASGKRAYVSSGLSASEAHLASKARLKGALEHVGPGLSDVLMRVCCQLEGLELAEKGLGWPSRSAKVVLLIALDRLADHYRIK